MYRVLYASSQRLGCFLETLARFRLDLKLYAELNEIGGDNDYVLLGQVPSEWAQRRAIGSAAHHGQYADIYGSEWIGRLRQALARDCVRLGIADNRRVRPGGICTTVTDTTGFADNLQRGL